MTRVRLVAYSDYLCPTVVLQRERPARVGNRDLVLKAEEYIRKDD